MLVPVHGVKSLPSPPRFRASHLISSRIMSTALSISGLSHLCMHSGPGGQLGVWTLQLPAHYLGRYIQILGCWLLPMNLLK